MPSRRCLCRTRGLLITLCHFLSLVLTQGENITLRRCTGDMIKLDQCAGYQTIDIHHVHFGHPQAMDANCSVPQVKQLCITPAPDVWHRCNNKPYCEFYVRQERPVLCKHVSQYLEVTYGCKNVSCPELPAIANGSLVPVATTSYYPVSTQVVYSCRAGLEISGSATRTCNQYGEWTGITPACSIPQSRCPSTSFSVYPYGESCYEVVESIGNYSQASQYCAERGGDLTTVRQFNVLDFLEWKLLQVSPFGYYWIGRSYLDDVANANHDQTTPVFEKKCREISRRGMSWQMSLTDCSNLNKFICQYEAIPVSTTLGPIVDATPASSGMLQGKAHAAGISDTTGYMIGLIVALVIIILLVAIIVVLKSRRCASRGHLMDRKAEDGTSTMKSTDHNNSNGHAYANKAFDYNDMDGSAMASKQNTLQNAENINRFADQSKQLYAQVNKAQKMKNRQNQASIPKPPLLPVQSNPYEDVGDGEETAGEEDAADDVMYASRDIVNPDYLDSNADAYPDSPPASLYKEREDEKSPHSTLGRKRKPNQGYENIGFFDLGGSLKAKLGPYQAFLIDSAISTNNGVSLDDAQEEKSNRNQKPLKTFKTGELEKNIPNPDSPRDKEKRASNTSNDSHNLYSTVYDTKPWFQRKMVGSSSSSEKGFAENFMNNFDIKSRGNFLNENVDNDSVFENASVNDAEDSANDASSSVNDTLGSVNDAAGYANAEAIEAFRAQKSSSFSSDEVVMVDNDLYESENSIPM